VRGRTLTLVLVCCAATAGGASADLYGTQATAARIAFARGTASGHYDIWTMAANGTSARRLTTSCLVDWWPDWSPDRRHIAFARSCGGTFRVYVVDADGSAARAVTPARLNAQWPTWSPDGRRLGFSGGPFDREEIYVINVDGTGLRRLTDDTAADQSPDWSPDGRWILYARLRRSGPADIMTVSPTSKVQRPVGIRGGEPAWSPDGKRIAFARRDRSVARETIDLWIAQANGRAARRLVNERAGVTSHHPAWSPDGAQIAFMSNRIEGKNGGSIYVRGAEGVHRVAKSPAEDTDPAWAA
jgi:TolB protein